MGTGHPQEVFQGLVISEQISAVGCTPVAPFHQLMRASPPPAPQRRAPRGGQGHSAGIWSLLGERVICQGASGTLPCLCSSFSFFSTFRVFFFPPSLLPAGYAALPPLSTHSSCLDFSFPSTNMCSLGSFSSLPSSPHQCCLPKLLFLLPFSLFSHRPTSFLPLPASLSFPPASRAPVHSLCLPFSDSLGEICLCQHTNSIIYWLSGAGSYTRL